MYLLTNERYKTYQMGFSFGHLGHGPGVGLSGTVRWGRGGGGGAGGSKEFFFRNSTRFRALGPWGGVKNLIF